MPVYAGTRSVLRNPPAAVSAWTPLSLPSLLLWHVADDIAQADASAVTTWADKSGNGRTIEQATGGLQPTYETNEKNGHAVVRFDATDDRLVTSANLGVTIGTGNFTMACVAKTTATFADQRTIMGMSDTVGMVQFYSTSKINFRINGDNAYNTTISTSTWYTIIISRSGTAVNLWLNGTVDATTLTKGDSIANTTWTYGSRASSVQPLGSDLPEALLTNAAISAGDRASLESYWRTKYAHY